MQRRLKALEAKLAQDGHILTESQLQPLERAQREEEAHGLRVLRALTDRGTEYCGNSARHE